jgi:hypothetical protein
MIARLVLLSFLTAFHCTAGELIRQVQKVNGQSLTYDFALTGDSGQIVSKPIPSTDATFYLYTQVTSGSTTTLRLLDQKTVGTYLPAAKVKILSKDPAVPARTRIDESYGVEIEISGMSIAPEAPAYAKQLQVRRGYALYDPETRTTTPTTAKGEYLNTFEFKSNGKFEASAFPWLPWTPAEETHQAMGEEYFKVLTYPDASTPQSVLASASIKIWPLAEVTITGIEEGKTYVAPPTGEISLKNLYPKSTTYAQIYKGPQKDGTLGTIFSGDTVLAYNTTEPQNAKIPISQLGNFIDEDGEYTVEILTLTPFGENGAPEIIGEVTFKVDETLNINGGVTTFE